MTLCYKCRGSSNHSRRCRSIHSHLGLIGKKKKPFWMNFFGINCCTTNEKIKLNKKITDLQTQILILRNKIERCEEMRPVEWRYDVNNTSDNNAKWCNIPSKECFVVMHDNHWDKAMMKEEGLPLRRGDPNVVNSKIKDEKAPRKLTEWGRKYVRENEREDLSQLSPGSETIAAVSCQKVHKKNHQCNDKETDKEEYSTSPCLDKKFRADIQKCVEQCVEDTICQLILESQQKGLKFYSSDSSK